MTDSVSQPRRAQLASRVLARSARMGDRAASGLARSVRERHRLAALSTHPRLMPRREPGRPQVALTASTEIDVERPAAPPAVAGMSDFAARWLFGDGQVGGTPFASGAAVPREHAGQLPAFLAARGRPPARPQPAAAGRSTAAVRGQVQEGQPVRLSPVPAADPTAPPAVPTAPPAVPTVSPAVPTMSRSADRTAPDEPLPPPARPDVEPPGARGNAPTQPPARQSAARRPATPAAAARGESSRPAPARVALQRERVDAELPAPRQRVTIAPRTPPAAERPEGEQEGPAVARPPSRWRAALDRVAATLRPSSPEPAEAARAATPSVRSPVTTSPRSAPLEADGPVHERAPRRTSTPTASGGRPRPVLAARRRPAASPVVTAPPAEVGQTARPHAQPGADPTGPPAGQRLARVAGAVVSRQLDRGVETIDFAPPARRPPTATLLSPAISVTAGGAPGAGATADPAPSETAHTTADALASASPGAPPAAAAPDIDDLYEQVVERLRRDLLCERERMGDLLGDLP
jgi:hypothetical protein